MWALLFLCVIVASAQEDPTTPASAAHTSILQLQFNQGNRLYYGKMTVGSPGQEFNMLFDTGSADSWVFSDKYADLKARRGYDQTRSNTSQLDGRRFYALYNNEIEIGGHLTVDQFTIAGMTIESQTFGVVTASSNVTFLGLFEFDGVIGLAFPALSQRNIVPVLENMVQQGLLVRPQFSVYLNKNTTLGGEILFGGSDKSRYEGQLSYIKLSTPQYWQIQNYHAFLTLPFVKQKIIDITKLNEQYIIIDTGTSYFALSERIGKNVIYNLPTKRIHTLMTKHHKLLVCDTKHMPNITLHLGPINVEVRPEDYVVMLDEPTGTQRPTSMSKKSDRKECVPGFRPILAETGFSTSLRIGWVFGNAFLRNYYAVFDYENQQLGLAKSK